MCAINVKYYLENRSQNNVAGASTRMVLLIFNEFLITRFIF